MKVSITIDGIKLKTNLNKNQTLNFFEKSSFYTILGFTRSHFCPLDDIDGTYQLIAGSYSSEKPINVIATEKIHLKCDCIDGSILKGIHYSLVFSFALNKPSYR